MKINNRVIIILGVAVCSLLIALAIISHFFILNTFTDIEHKQTVADMQRILTRLNDNVEEVAAVCRDWAQWDDSYRFVDDLNAEYISANLAEPALFRNMKINYILFYNSSGDLVYSRGYNPRDGTIQDTPPHLIAIIRDSILPSGFSEGISGRRGYSLLNGELVIIAGYQITHSDQRGPPAGTLIMVRQLDVGDINDIAQQTDLDITIRKMPSMSDTVPFSTTDLEQVEDGAILVKPVNDTVMEGAASLTGIENTPTEILVTVQSSRYLYQQVQVSMAYIAGAIIILAIVLIIVIRWPLKKYIVNPILSLDSSMKAIGRSGDISRQVPLDGDDELVSLASSLNQMLAVIQNSQQLTRESESRFRALAETSVAGIFVFRQKILYANPGAEIQTGYSRDELLTMNFWEFIHPDFQDRIRNLVKRRLQGQDVSTRAEFKIIRKDGQERWIESSATLLPYDGEQALLSVRLDITESKRVEEALRENEEKFRALTENTPDIVFSADLTGIFTYISPQVEKYGFHIDDLTGRSALDFVFPEDWQEFSDNFVRTFEHGSGHSTPFRIMDRWQNIHWMEANFAVTLDREGKPAGLQGMFRDITERRNAMDALTLANKKLNLMYDITRHDILNKITILFGLIDMTSASTSPVEREEFLREIRDSGEAIYRQIVLTRDYQQVGVKAPQWNRMKEVISRAFSNFSGSGVHFMTDIEYLEIYADPLIEKVMYNLIDNAIRYGKKISMISFSKQISDKGLELIVEDDGIGIAMDAKERIFERGFGNNTGLGLFLSREILMITGITIRENGDMGKGARFVLSLPKGTYRFSEK